MNTTFEFDSSTVGIVEMIEHTCKAGVFDEASWATGAGGFRLGLGPGLVTQVRLLGPDGVSCFRIKR